MRLIPWNSYLLNVDPVISRRHLLFPCGLYPETHTCWPWMQSINGSQYIWSILLQWQSYLVVLHKNRPHLITPLRFITWNSYLLTGDPTIKVRITSRSIISSSASSIQASFYYSIAVYILKVIPAVCGSNQADGQHYIRSALHQRQTYLVVLHE